MDPEHVKAMWRTADVVLQRWSGPKVYDPHLGYEIESNLPANPAKVKAVMDVLTSSASDDEVRQALRTRFKLSDADTAKLIRARHPGGSA